MGWDAPCFPPSVFEATRRAPEKAVEGFNTIVRAPAAGELGRWRGGDGAPSHEGLCLCSPRACPRFSGRHVAWNRAWDASGRAGGPPAAQQARHPLVAPCSCATALPGPPVFSRPASSCCWCRSHTAAAFASPTHTPAAAQQTSPASPHSRLQAPGRHPCSPAPQPGHHAVQPVKIGPPWLPQSLRAPRRRPTRGRQAGAAGGAGGSAGIAIAIC